MYEAAAVCSGDVQAVQNERVRGLIFYGVGQEGGQAVPEHSQASGRRAGVLRCVREAY